MAIEVLSPGLLTTVQDLGRYGYQKQGIPVSGVMDTAAYHAANRLVGNRGSEAVLEMTLLGGTYRFTESCRIAITGADMKPTLNDQPVRMYEELIAEKDSVLQLNSAQSGCRTYLAVAGGIDVPLIMGSRSTHRKCRIGGYEGRALKAGDVLPIGIPAETSGVSASEIPPVYTKDITVRVILGPQDSFFTEKGIYDFFHSSYVVAADSDRMGIRLNGPAVESFHGTDIVSDGIVFGSIQITGSGLPIVLMADRQTTGGYAKIATVYREDLPLLAQAVPASVVHFEMLTEDLR